MLFGVARGVATWVGLVEPQGENDVFRPILLALTLLLTFVFFWRHRSDVAPGSENRLQNAAILLCVSELKAVAIGALIVALGSLAGLW